MTAPIGLNNVWRDGVTAPVGTLPAGIPSETLPPNVYFDIAGSSTTTTFASDWPTVNTTATATGLTAGQAATIPTDPFASVPRLPGYQNVEVVAYSGGWHDASAPVDNAPSTWGNACFRRGIGTKGFSHGSVVLANVTNGANPNTGTNDAAIRGPATISTQPAAASVSPTSSSTDTMSDMRPARRAMLAGIARC